MKETHTNAAIAIATVVGALIMLIALSFAIGKWSMGGISTRSSCGSPSPRA